MSASHRVNDSLASLAHAGTAEASQLDPGAAIRRRVRRSARPRSRRLARCIDCRPTPEATSPAMPTPSSTTAERQHARCVGTDRDPAGGGAGVTDDVAHRLDDDAVQRRSRRRLEHRQLADLELDPEPGEPVPLRQLLERRRQSRRRPAPVAPARGPGCAPPRYGRRARRRAGRAAARQRSGSVASRLRAACMP